MRDSNDDLNRLREQAQQLNNLKPTKLMMETKRYIHTQKRPQGKTRSFGITRKASQALHQALWTAWSQRNATQFTHLVRLFLDNRPGDEIQLDLVISCLPHGAVQTVLSMPFSSMMVHVRSQARAWMEAHAYEEDHERRKRPRVRFADDAPSDSTITRTPRASSPNRPVSLDLGSCEHFCSYLVLKPEDRPPHSCVGHIDTSCDESFRHSFFPCAGDQCSPSVCQRKVGYSGELTRMDEILSRPMCEELSVLHQLQLAYRITAAVLKFNSTPWLEENWDLRSLTFFQLGSDLPSSLQTLHISVELGQSPQKGSTMDVDAADMNNALEDAKFMHGIQNLTLYNLGVALLSIGRWTPVNSNDIVQVRRMASRMCPLGPRYHEMTQKVLDCDFGFGKDLRKVKLQEAVYDNVLLELEDMMSTLAVQE